MTDPRFTAAFRDQRYSVPEQLWSGDPNPALVEEAAFLTPGAALEVGCGEGADAIWPATHGWQVTGVDFSAQALRRAAAHAPEHLADRVTWQQADVRAWTAVPDIALDRPAPVAAGAHRHHTRRRARHHPRHRPTCPAHPLNIIESAKEGTP